MKSYEEIELNLGTLAAGTSIKTNLKIDGNREQGCRISKIRYALSVVAKPALGPILYGLCSADLTVAELDECLDSNPEQPNAVPEQEEAMRQVVPFGLIPKGLIETVTNIMPYMRGSWFWEVPEGQGLQFFCRNQDDAALTGATLIDFSAFISGVWLDD